MLDRTLLIAAAFVLGTVSLPSQAGVDIDIRIVPPLPRLDVVSAPRFGYIWVPGFWRPEGRHAVWTPGHWVHDRTSQNWSHERWPNEPRASGRYESDRSRARDMGERRDRPGNRGHDNRSRG